MTVRNKYARFGLRADRNLSDLPDNLVALGNVLDDLVPDTPFTGFDLKVIDGLRNSNLSTNDLKELRNQVSTYIPLNIINGVVTTGLPTPTLPVLTIQNVIDNRKTIFGDPPMFRGGLGPRATVFPGSAVYNNSELGAFPIFDPENDFIQVNTDYWLDGFFGFSGSLHPTFEDNFGGVQFEGYLGVNDTENISLKTNGHFVIERDEAFKGYVPILANTTTSRKIVLQESGTDMLEFDARVISADAIVDGAEEHRNRWIGTCVFLGDIIETGGTRFEVTGVEYDLENERASASHRITLTKIDGPLNGITANNNDELDINDFAIGEENSQQFSIPGDRLFLGELRQYRITLWWPNARQIDNNDTRLNYTSKWATFDFSDNTSENPAPYVYWYEEHPDLSGSKFSYQYFINNRISNRNERTATFVESNRQIFSDYTPTPITAEQWDMVDLIYKGRNRFELNYRSRNGFTIQEGDRLIIDALIPGQTDDRASFHFIIYEVRGNSIWVEPTGPQPSELFEQVGVNFVGNTPGGTSQPDPGVPHDLDVLTSAYIIKADGLQGIYFVETAQVTDAGNASQPEEQFARIVKPSDITYFYNYPGDPRYSLKNIKPDNLIYTVNYDPVARIDTNQLSHRVINSFANTSPAGLDSVDVTIKTIAPSTTNTSRLEATGPNGVNTGFVAVYSHRGLDDASVDIQCVGVFGKEVKSFPEAPVGSSTIAVDSIEGIEVGDYVQYKGIVAEPTRVTAVGATTTTVDGITYHNVEIDTSLISNLPNAFTLLFIKNAQAGNYIVPGSGGLRFFPVDYCVLPFNTAPPFLGTRQGLSTSVEYPHLDTNPGGKLAFTEFELDTVETNVSSPGTASYERAIRIEDAQGNTYFMLASNVPTG